MTIHSVQTDALAAGKVQQDDVLRSYLVMTNPEAQT
jgi:hypothetical protein